MTADGASCRAVRGTLVPRARAHPVRGKGRAHLSTSSVPNASLFLGLRCGRRRDREEWSWKFASCRAGRAWSTCATRPGPPPQAARPRRRLGRTPGLSDAQRSSPSPGATASPVGRSCASTSRRSTGTSGHPPRPDSDDEDLDLVDRFLALRLPDVHRRRRPATAAEAAAALLDAHPELATASVHAMAAANEADALRAAIAADPTVVERPGGPHRWVPLLYAAYARVPGARRSTRPGPARRRCRPERRQSLGRHVPVHRLDRRARRRRGRAAPRTSMGWPSPGCSSRPGPTRTTPRRSTTGRSCPMTPSGAALRVRPRHRRPGPVGGPPRAPRRIGCRLSPAQP